VAFAAIGLFAGLAGLFLAVTLHHPSLALAGAVLCAMFGAGVVAQLLAAAWPVTREFEAGRSRWSWESGSPSWQPKAGSVHAAPVSPSTQDLAIEFAGDPSELAGRKFCDGRAGPR